jgi:hypothetical protein
VAKSLINETFELIEKCYNAIKENNLKYLKWKQHLKLLK